MVGSSEMITRVYDTEWNVEDETCSLCKRIAKFSIRRIKTGDWLFVCPNHDNFIGVENLMLLGYSKSDAKEINRAVKTQLPDLFNDERFGKVVKEIGCVEDCMKCPSCNTEKVNGIR